MRLEANPVKFQLLYLFTSCIYAAHLTLHNYKFPGHHFNSHNLTLNVNVLCSQMPLAWEAIFNGFLWFLQAGKKLGIWRLAKRELGN